MKTLSHVVIIHQNCSVKDAETRIGQYKGKQIMPDQFKNAALPDHHQLDEALEPFGRIVIPVFVNIF